ncbi:hypothetical protein DHEL01_v208727 [Diaporthe helianthi]|uniref:Uncharacterized protein n=1 Tax=Diaporthe helianthi TaxID=158607 RepID=A0A2P5HRI4_DIAHE|nr:hypothetical protein DHEL01_v208727 [Diaporthe helianthi]
MKHGGSWTTDQPVGMLKFIKGGQSNGLAFTQNTHNKVHCLTSLRVMLDWHMAGNGQKMARDMIVEAIHCPEPTV